MKYAAIIKGDECLNVVVLPDDWTGQGKLDWQPPQDCELRMCKLGEYGPGFKKVGDSFYHQNLVELDETTKQYKLRAIEEL